MKTPKRYLLVGSVYLTAGDTDVWSWSVKMGDVAEEKGYTSTLQSALDHLGVALTHLGVSPDQQRQENA